MRKLPLIIFTLIAFLFYLTSTLTYASKNKDEHENKSDSKFETRFETTVSPSNNNRGQGNHEGKSEAKIEIKIENEEEEDEPEEENNQKIKIEINKNRFEIRGIASNVTVDSFMISGQLIKIDPSVSGKVEIKGALANGTFVQTEGVVVNNMLFAREIKVKSNIEVASPTPTSVPTPTVTPTTSPSITPSLTPSPTATAPSEIKAFIKVKIKGAFTLEQLATIFEGIISLIKSALGVI